MKFFFAKYLNVRSQFNGVALRYGIQFRRKLTSFFRSSAIQRRNNSLLNSMMLLIKFPWKIRQFVKLLMFTEIHFSYLARQRLIFQILFDFQRQVRLDKKIVSSFPCFLLFLNNKIHFFIILLHNSNFIYFLHLYYYISALILNLFINP